MAILNCTMCGGHLEMTADRSIGICECCGSAITFPKVDDDQLAAAFNRGNHFRRMGEFDKALAVYERIVQQDDTEAEAHWCCALCRFGIEYVEDPASLEWIPTCHRASFDSFLEDVDYLAALKHSTGAKRIQYQKYAAKIAEVQRGILATSQNAEPFDVFICYKETDEQGQRTRDSLLAQDIYYQLTEQGRRVFFARITLEDIAGSQYEPYIFAALNSARVMVVVGTKPEHLNAVWVKNEWSRFLALMRKDHSRLLLPCYRDMDPYDLPEQLSVLQSYDMSKIGFIQDLIRGISKVLDAEKKPEPARETVVMQANSNVAALLKRGNMALEDGDWEKADSFYEEVLNQDPECAEAYVGKTLSEEKCRSLDAFVEKRLSLYKDATPQTLSIKSDLSRATEVSKKYTIPSYLNFDTILALYNFNLNYTSDVKSREQHLQAEQAYWKNHKQLSRAAQFDKDASASKLNTTREQIFTTLTDALQQARSMEITNRETLLQKYQAHLQNAENLATQRYQQACETRDKDYDKWVAAIDTAETEEAFFRLCKSFKSLEGYRDSADLAKQCEQRVNEIKAQKKAKWVADHQKSDRARRKRIVVAVLVIVFLISGAIGFVHLARLTKYNNAVEQMEQGNYSRALNAFRELEDYRDSESKIKEIWQQVAQKDVLSASFSSSIALKADGTVSATGYGISDFLDTINGWRNIVAVSISDSHAVALNSNGRISVAGNISVTHENELLSWEDIVAISAGKGCTVGIKSDGTVVSWGLRNGDKLSNWSDITAISVSSTHTAGLKLNGKVIVSPDAPSDYGNVSSWYDIIAVAAGNRYTVGLKSDGTVLTTDDTLQTSDWNNITAISAADGFVVGLKNDGTVIYAGRAVDGLDEIKQWNDIVSISCGTYHVLGLKSDGTVVCAGRQTEKQGEVSDWKDVKIPD